ncbi:MAG: hypothetical protein L3J25_02765 [Flavobacteriaceae bacterium]|nr:hypothetical protein [Flavobacteriaceae bacterium]
MIISFTNKIVALILSIILLTHNINNAIIIGDFIINQDIIAKTLCIQKEEQKGCNGKCQLRKELSQNINSDSNSESQIPETKRMALDFYNITNSNNVKSQWAWSLNTKHKIITNSNIPTSIYYDVDTPPPIFS